MKTREMDSMMHLLLLLLLASCTTLGSGLSPQEHSTGHPLNSAWKRQQVARRLQRHPVAIQAQTAPDVEDDKSEDAQQRQLKQVPEEGVIFVYPPASAPEPEEPLGVIIGEFEVAPAPGPGNYYITPDYDYAPEPAPAATLGADQGQ